MIAKHKQIKRALFIVTATIALCAIVAGTLFRDGFIKFPGPLKAVTENSDAPRFIFDTAKHPDWWSLGSIQQDLSETGDEAPVSSIGVHQCIEGSNCSNFVAECKAAVSEKNPHCMEIEKRMDDGCMVHAYFFATMINPEAMVANELAEWSGFGVSPTETAVTTLTMTTPDGEKEYQFFQYDTNNSSSEYKRGSAFGFIALSGGHIEVRSICRHAGQLGNTLPVLGALRLES